MSKKYYHYTNEDNLGTIKDQGLQINSDTHLTEGGTWADKAYGLRPIYLCLQENIGYQEECDVVLQINNDPEIVADLPGLVDMGAFFDLDVHNGYSFWEDDKKIPVELLSYHDDEYGIDVADLLTPGHPVANAAISVTQTAACLKNIPAEQI